MRETRGLLFQSFARIPPSEVNRRGRVKTSCVFEGGAMRKYRVRPPCTPTELASPLRKTYPTNYRRPRV